MSRTLGLVFVLLYFQVAEFTDPPDCLIELECEECLPDNMPRVESHAPDADGVVRVPHGAVATLECGGGRFLAYPLLGSLAATCLAGRYRAAGDPAPRALLDLGCQESVLEDVQHHVEHCGAPLQGRAYRARAGAGARHLATLCFDADRGAAAWLRASSAPLRLPPHSDERAPLSLLGNFNEMFDARSRLDAERLFGDDARLTRRVRELLKHERFSFAGQTLTAARLLSARYWGAAEARAAEFASNKAAAWSGVARGNLRLLQADVAALLRRGAGEPLEVFAGAHGVLALAGRELFLRGARFPVARYLWTAVLAPGARRGAALVLLNDPFVRVSEIRAAVFCESRCGALGWLTELHRHRNYERPAHGLVFCCELKDFAAVVPEMPPVFNETFQLLT